MNWWIAWLVAYVVAIYAIGVYYARKIDSADEYIVANFSLGLFPIAGSIVATCMGAASVIGNAGKGFTIGLSWLVATSPAMLVSILMAVFMGATIRKLKLYTVPDLFVRRYGKATGVIPAIITALLFMTPVFAMQLVGMGSILTTITNISLTWAMLIGFVLCVGFTVMGGMPSVAWTDAVQAVLIVGGLIIMMILGINHIGGVGELIANTPKQVLSPTGMNMKNFINLLLIWGPYNVVLQTTWQRITAAKTEKTAVRGVTLGYVITLLMGVVAIIIGITARQVLPLDTAPDLVYTKFMAMLIHPAIGGLFMVTLFAALLTGATSFLLSGATNIVKDIYQQFVNTQATSNEVLKYSRISVCVIALLGLAIAFLIKDVMMIFMYAITLTGVTMLFPVLAAMYWKRVTKTGALSSIIGSLITSLIWNFAGRPFGLHEIIPGLLVSFILLVGVSLLTEHSPEEEVVAYYYSVKDDKEFENASEELNCS